MPKQKGFSLPLIIVLVLSISVLGTVAYWKFKQVPKPIPVSTTQTTSKPVETANPDLIGANWKTYTNTKYGYSIKYPPDLNYGMVNKENADKAIFANGPRDSYQFPENKFIGISVNTSLVNNVSLEDYLKEKYTENKYGLPTFETKLQNGEISKITVQGNLGYSAPEGMAFEHVERVIWFKRGETIFTLTAYGNGETPSIYTEDAGKVFDQIIATFKFSN